MGLNETLINGLVIAAHAIGANLLETTAAATSKTATASVTSSTARTLAFGGTNHSRATAGDTSPTTTSTDATRATGDNGSADGFDDRQHAALAVDTAVHFVAHMYGKLLQPPIMNTINVSLEYIESSTTPDAALAAAAGPNGNGFDGGGGASGDGAIAAALSVGALVAMLCKCVIMSFIILAAIFGNMLVIVSVMQHRRLR